MAVEVKGFPDYGHLVVGLVVVHVVNVQFTDEDFVVDLKEGKKFRFTLCKQEERFATNLVCSEIFGLC